MINLLFLVITKPPEILPIIFGKEKISNSPLLGNKAFLFKIELSTDLVYFLTIADNILLNFLLLIPKWIGKIKHLINVVFVGFFEKLT